MDRAHVVGRRIKRLRELASLSKSELARLAGVSPTAVHNWEENGVMPRMGAILKLEKVLEVSWMHLVSGVPDGEGAGVVPRHESEDLSGLTRGQHLERYKRAGASSGWHFLTGDQPQIDRVTKAAGFRYAWDAETKQYAHPSGVIVATPDGRLAKYLFGIEYGPRDLRFGIVEASEGKVGTPVDALLLYCYHYDPMTGRYGLAIMRAIRLAGAATVLAMGAFIVVMVRREKARGSTGSPRASHTARPELVEGRGRS